MVRVGPGDGKLEEKKRNSFLNMHLGWVDGTNSDIKSVFASAYCFAHHNLSLQFHSRFVLNLSWTLHGQDLKESLAPFSIKAVAAFPFPCISIYPVPFFSTFFKYRQTKKRWHVLERKSRVPLILIFLFLGSLYSCYSTFEVEKINATRLPVRHCTLILMYLGWKKPFFFSEV